MILLDYFEPANYDYDCIEYFDELDRPPFFTEEEVDTEDNDEDMKLLALSG